MENMYEKIAPFFTLLYVYDIQDIPLIQLQLLHQRLQAQKPVDEKLQPLYNMLQEASKRNIADKLKKKRQKKEMQDKGALVRQSKPKPKQQAIPKIEESLDYSKINQSTIEDIKGLEYKQIERKSGTIYNGELVINLQLSDLIKSKKIQVKFQIDSKKRQSCITKETLSQLGLNSSNPSLLVDNRKQKFYISNTNRLGLAFLQKYNALIECNFRPEYSSFELAYTE